MTTCDRCATSLSEFGAELEWCARLERLVNVEPFVVHTAERCADVVLARMRAAEAKVEAFASIAALIDAGATLTFTCTCWQWQHDTSKGIPVKIRTTPDPKCPAHGRRP